VPCYPGHPARSDRLVITSSDGARFIIHCSATVLDLVRDAAGQR